MGDDGDLLGEQSADVETELDHGGGSAAVAVAVAVAVVWEMMLHHLISTGHSDNDVTPRLCTLVSLSANSGAACHHHYLPSTCTTDYQGSAGQGRSCLDSFCKPIRVICTVRIESQMKTFSVIISPTHAARACYLLSTIYRPGHTLTLMTR